MKIPFLNSPKFWLVIILGLAFTPAHAGDGQSNNTNPESGFYVGLTYVDSEIDSDILDTSGDGEGYTIGYRFNNGLSIEYTLNRIDYDDINYHGTKVTNIEGDFQFLSLMYQGKYDKWEPYVRLAFADSEVDETQVYGNGSTASFSSSDDGFVVGIGTDYAFTDHVSLRLDYSIYSEDQAVLSLGPVIRF